ncbi:hypothetical protein [Kangiella aquimarina]|uniref:Uncharacterized protein n=1 Tax=Kangiella aquimarina TaxID=261965 RepID=A0ABZ0X6E2_9GAMM|nr:hypothetical protein [Kangiella aquimarina]WQG86176.1 hypothetical protein SR900_04605 [Kangiella aquimarina]
MDIILLKECALSLKRLIEKYSSDPEVKLLATALEELIEDILNDRVGLPLDSSQIPGRKLMEETNIRQYKDLSSTYSTFVLEASGGDDTWGDLRKIVNDIKKEIKN